MSIFNALQMCANLVFYITSIMTSFSCVIQLKNSQKGRTEKAIERGGPGWGNCNKDVGLHREHMLVWSKCIDTMGE